MAQRPRTAVQEVAPAYPNAMLSPLGSVPHRPNEGKWATITVPRVDATRRPKAPPKPSRKSKRRKGRRG